MVVEAGIVVVVGRSPDLDRALDALWDLDIRIRVIPTVTDAGYTLLGCERPRIKAVLVSLVEDPEGALELVRSLRNGSGLASVPIVVWAREGSDRILASACAAGADSGVLLEGGPDDPACLARTIQYWAVADRAEYVWRAFSGIRPAVAQRAARSARPEAVPANA